MTSRRRIRLAAALVAFGIAAAFVVKTAGVPVITRERRWAIGIYAGASPFDLRPAPTATNPVLCAEHVTDVPARFVADPFMIKRDSTWYMFFEVWNQNSGHGDIGLATSADGLQWAYQRVVLDEPFHLSYPYVFQWRDEYYLMPESGEANAVRLYRASEFPGRWQLLGALLTGQPYVDASPIRFGDQWWMFVQSNPLLNDTLRLYYADDLEGPWREHRQSPIVQGDAHVSRPGGRAFVFNGRPYRYAQDDAPTYGTQVWAFEITELTPSRYAERLVGEAPIVRAGEGEWNATGIHHIDAHPVRDTGWIACVDGYRKQWRVGLVPWW